MTTSNAILMATALTVGLTLADPVMALRCDRKIVSEGMPQGEVRKYCGEPTSTQERTIVRAGIPRSQNRTQSDRRGRQELLFADRSYEEIVVEEWTYNFGRHRFIYVIRFENGRVTAIEDLGYGYAK
ncbi:MAG: DUF2845 domain-containing protein [Pseudomonadales bacterium]